DKLVTGVQTCALPDLSDGFQLRAAAAVDSGPGSRKSEATQKLEEVDFRLDAWFRPQLRSLRVVPPTRRGRPGFGDDARRWCSDEIGRASCRDRGAGCA